ncbi:TrmH family RNA methyltransferase [Subsaximicrobium wynnwilliamsii]|uniref:TrmH family RNA methyltransferase n=1 Tax=Subsaximicrobium wynnwilliamsii TaxID=291179 RepID=A0A5C6ZQ94_9FLAO|nr:TrmH family RNA methyltransferase [Subsaximicrobium wynnwilliamsii]TXD85050.1 TrmH family RNA methyltransferase [Subsaximicrobium wynnwilliamsii]TXD91093.1 TrmH family RNA methyltransferase [Subsaximicrobium wynnwilliamsii]TXE04487.1 TrmH family RNA methyltransferase [Subsaximicrobium wynnwilliamsii]
MQLDHHSTNFTSKKFPITLICEQVGTAANIGSLFRTADAFGVEKLIFCGKEIPMGRKMTKTSRATEKYVDYEVSENIQEKLSDLKQKNYFLVALEITEASHDLKSFEFPKQKRIALVIGEENFGISEAVLQQMDAVVHIPMFGQNSSMNLVQASSVALYEITNQMS